MKLNEGYKAAVQEYDRLTGSDGGRDFVTRLNAMGIPKEHLLWAARILETGDDVDLQLFLQQYREWKRFAVPYFREVGEQAPDITTLDFNSLRTAVRHSKEYWEHPNTIYQEEGVTVCEIRTFKDAYMLPIDSTWCITKSRSRFNEFCGDGKICLYIINRNANQPYRNVLALIAGGNVEYWDEQNKRMSEYGDTYENERRRFIEYQKSLPKEVLNIIYGYAAEQGEMIDKGEGTYGELSSIAPSDHQPRRNDEEKLYKMKTINETRLRKIVSESISKYFGQIKEGTDMDFENAVNVAIRRLANGEAPEKVFEFCGFVGPDGCRRVRLKGKYNVLNREGRFISDTWFDDIDNIGVYADEYRLVVQNDKYNFINDDGQFAFDTWFDYVGYMADEEDYGPDYTPVYLNGKMNLLNREGWLVFDTWPDYVGNMDEEGCIVVGLNGKEYSVKTVNGKVVGQIQQESKASRKPILSESAKPIRISKTDLKQLVKSCVETAMNQKLEKIFGKLVKRDGYEDDPKMGWDWQEKYERKRGEDEETIKALEKSYDKYGRECAKKGEVASGLGFDIWRNKKDLADYKRGGNGLYPNY